MGVKKESISSVPVLSLKGQQHKQQQQQKLQGDKFPSSKIEIEARDVLDAYLHRHRYDPEQCSRLTQDLCSIVRSKVKQLLGERWKIVVQVLMGEESGNCQNLRMASRCLWNNGGDCGEIENPDVSRGQRSPSGVSSDKGHQTSMTSQPSQDTFVSTVYRNKHIYAVCVVYAVYQS